MVKRTTDFLKTATGIVTLSGGLILIAGTGYTFYGHFAKQADHEALVIRVGLDEVNQALRESRKELFDYREQCGMDYRGPKCDELDRQKIEEIK